MNPPKKEKKISHICISSITAASLTNILLVPFDVLKVRLQKLSMKNSQKVPLIPTALHILKQEGVKTFFNGLKYSVMFSIGFNLSLLLGYDRLSSFTAKQITNHPVFKPLFSSAISTGLATIITFPLEYWKTIQQSFEGEATKKGFQLGSKLYSALIVSLQRNVGFFLIFWPINENVQTFLRKKSLFQDLSIQKDPSTTRDLLFYWKSFFLHWSAGVCAASIGVVFTQPLDVVKTRKQIDLTFQEQGSVRIMRDILKKEGFRHLFVGLQPRFFRNLVYGSIFFSIFENFCHLCDDYLPF